VGEDLGAGHRVVTVFGKVEIAEEEVHEEGVVGQAVFCVVGAEEGAAVVGLLVDKEATGGQEFVE
jgi:hypothetical protein